MSNVTSFFASLACRADNLDEAMPILEQVAKKDPVPGGVALMEVSKGAALLALPCVGLRQSSANGGLS